MTSLVAKKDLLLATRIEDAMRKNESLESLTVDSVRRDIARAKITSQKGKSEKLIKVAKYKNKTKADYEKSSRGPDKVVGAKSKKASVLTKTTKGSKTALKSVKLSSASSSRKPKLSGKKQLDTKRSREVKSPGSKLNVVGFRGRTSSSNNKKSLMPS